MLPINRLLQWTTNPPWDESYSRHDTQNMERGILQWGHTYPDFRYIYGCHSYMNNLQYVQDKIYQINAFMLQLYGCHTYPDTFALHQSVRISVASLYTQIVSKNSKSYWYKTPRNIQNFLCTIQKWVVLDLYSFHK